MSRFSTVSIPFHLTSSFYSKMAMILCFNCLMVSCLFAKDDDPLFCRCHFDGVRRCRWVQLSLGEGCRSSWYYLQCQRKPYVIDHLFPVWLYLLIFDQLSHYFQSLATDRCSPGWIREPCAPLNRTRSASSLFSLEANLTAQNSSSAKSTSTMTPWLQQQQNHLLI